MSTCRRCGLAVAWNGRARLWMLLRLPSGHGPEWSCAASRDGHDGGTPP